MACIVLQWSRSQGTERPLVPHSLRFRTEGIVCTSETDIVGVPWHDARCPTKPRAVYNAQPSIGHGRGRESDVGVREAEHGAERRGGSGWGRAISRSCPSADRRWTWKRRVRLSTAVERSNLGCWSSVKSDGEMQRSAKARGCWSSVKSDGEMQRSGKGRG